MKLCPVGFRQKQTWQYKSMVPKTKQKEREKGLTFAFFLHPVPHNQPVITNMSISPMHPNTLPPYYQTIPNRVDEGYWPGHGERLGNMGVFGTFEVPLHDNDTRGVIVQIVEHWGCEPEEGWTPTRNFRSSIISRRVEAHVTGCGHVHTKVVFPPHLLDANCESWVVEVDARAIYIPAATETPQDILQRLGFVWNTAQLRYVVNPTTGVTFSEGDCRWFLRSWAVPQWDLKRCIRLRHLQGNASGCLLVDIVEHTVTPRDGEERPLDLVALYE